MADSRVPIGIELVRRGIIAESDIQKALEYQKEHPEKKIGDILSILQVCDNQKLIEAIAEILGEKPILLNYEDIKLNVLEYISMDLIKQYKLMPFEITGNKIQVCFTDATQLKAKETIRLLLLNKGLVMDRYITFTSNIEEIIKRMEARFRRKN